MGEDRRESSLKVCSCSGALFMFPGCLAEGPLSLRPGERGTALSLSAELSPEGAIESHSIVASHVVPTEKMTYDEIDQAIAAGDSAKISDSLHAFLEVRFQLHQSEALRPLCRHSGPKSITDGVHEGYIQACHAARKDTDSGQHLCCYDCLH